MKNKKAKTSSASEAESTATEQNKEKLISTTYQGLPMNPLIGGPLSAAANANSAMANTEESMDENLEEE